MTSGLAVASGLPFWAVLSLPFLFAAGMSLFDTLDGCFMNFAYGWAFSRPVRKVYYNITITALSVVVAFFHRHGRAALGLLSQDNATSTTGSGVQDADLQHQPRPDFVIVGMFVATWAVGLICLALRRTSRPAGSAAAAKAQGRLSDPPEVDGRFSRYP